MVFWVIGRMYFPLEHCWSDEYAKHPFLYKVFFYYVAFTVKRGFYYSPFSATTGAIVASGLGYNGVKKSDDGKEI